MIVGDSTSWRQRLLDVHELLLARITVVWPGCSRRFGPAALENPVTDQLVMALRKDPIAGKKFLIESQHKLLDEDRQGDVVTKGFVDIAVFFNLSPDVYLAFECKRLNVHYGDKRESLAGKYAEDGVMRYVSAQYARRLALGAMLGYVMDGKSEWALAQLRLALSRRSSTLCLVEPLVDLTPVDSVLRFRTLHLRAGDRRPFEVRHGLLPLESSSVGGA